MQILALLAHSALEHPLPRKKTSRKACASRSALTYASSTCQMEGEPLWRLALEAAAEIDASASSFGGAAALTIISHALKSAARRRCALPERASLIHSSPKKQAAPGDALLESARWSAEKDPGERAGEQAHSAREDLQAQTPSALSCERGRALGQWPKGLQAFTRRLKSAKKGPAARARHIFSRRLWGAQLLRGSQILKARQRRPSKGRGKLHYSAANAGNARRPVDSLAALLIG